MSASWFDHPQYLPPQKLKLSEAEVVSALRIAWKNIYGEYPSDDSLGILYAQSALETGRFSAGFHNFNLGHLKATLSYINLGGEHFFTMFEAGEIIGGKEFIFHPPHVQTMFRAYKTLIAGAEDYIRFLSQRSRYKTAWAQLVKGNPIAYSHELKVNGYYTASEKIYTAGVVRLFEEFHRRKDELLSWEPKENVVEEDGEVPVEIEGSPSSNKTGQEEIHEDRDTTTIPPPSDESNKEIVVPPLTKPPVIKTDPEPEKEDDDIPDFKGSKTKGIVTVVVLAFAGFVASMFQGCSDFFSSIFN